MGKSDIELAVMDEAVGVSNYEGPRHHPEAERHIGERNRYLPHLESQDAFGLQIVMISFIAM